MEVFNQQRRKNAFTMLSHPQAGVAMKKNQHPLFACRMLAQLLTFVTVLFVMLLLLLLLCAQHPDLILPFDQNGIIPQLSSPINLALPQQLAH
eukprot:1153873-Pelagomonas_calceolata.AAC.3